MPIPIKAVSRPAKSAADETPLASDLYHIAQAGRRIEQMLTEWRLDNASRTRSLSGDAGHRAATAAGRRMENLIGEWSLSNARKARQLVQENLALKQALFGLTQDNAELRRVLGRKAN